MTVPAPVRVVGWILGDLATALVGTKLLVQALVTFHSHSRTTLLNELILVCVPAAFLLGYIAYTVWPHESAKWIWIAGVLWAGTRILSFLHASLLLRAVGASNGVLWEMSGRGCESAPFSESCQSFMMYTFPSLEVTFYALGAAGAWKLWGYRPHWLPKIDSHTGPPRREEDILDECE